MADSKAIAARVHPDVHEWMKQRAEEQGTTLGSFVEEVLRGYYQSHQVPESTDPSDWPDERAEQSEELPSGVYRPDSHEYNYAVKFTDRGGETENRYYKTREKAIQAAQRIRESSGQEVRA